MAASSILLAIPLKLRLFLGAINLVSAKIKILLKLNEPAVSQHSGFPLDALRVQPELST